MRELGHAINRSIRDRPNVSTMTQISETHVEAIIAACSENSAAIAESLNLCFDRSYRIEVGEAAGWDADAAPDDLSGPGLSVVFRVGTQAVLCLIPQSLPLPEWYTAPGDSENSRLQTLSLEWSMNMLPIDLEAEEFASIQCEELKQQIIESEPAEWSRVLELLVYEDSGGDDVPAEVTGAPSTAEEESVEEGTAEEQAEGAADPASDGCIAKLYLIAAVERPPLPEPDTIEPENPEDTPVPADNDSAAAGMIDQKILDLPVTVSVRLAEKKIELGQLSSIAPGGLVTFNKGCESLLDLYVNNYLYGRGEAIKIGEKFGLKVTHIGVKPERKERVL